MPDHSQKNRISFFFFSENWFEDNVFTREAMTLTIFLFFKESDTIFEGFTVFYFIVFWGDIEFEFLFKFWYICVHIYW